MDCKLSLAAHFPKQHEARSSRTRDTATKESTIASKPETGFLWYLLSPNRDLGKKPGFSSPHDTATKESAIGLKPETGFLRYSSRQGG
jgi:hypothetical protein